MGNFYTNVTTRGPSQAELAAFLRELGRRAFVTPATNSFTTLYDEECESQDTDVLASLALTVSTHFRCPALAVLNHDDDVLWYQLHAEGRQVDEYISAPSWWDTKAGPAPKGDPEILCGVIGAPGDPARVRKILNRGTGVLGYVFAYRRHADLVQALGHPSFAVGLGYDYLKKGDLPEGLTSEQLLLV